MGKAADKIASYHDPARVVSLILPEGTCPLSSLIDCDFPSISDALLTASVFDARLFSSKLIHPLFLAIPKKAAPKSGKYGKILNQLPS